MTGDILKDSAEIFANIQEKAPVVHNISNYITATDCANMTLACGGSPTMADDRMRLRRLQRHVRAVLLIWEIQRDIIRRVCCAQVWLITR